MALPIRLLQHIPLRVNSAGMIPLIFAQAILTFPAIIANLFTAVMVTRMIFDLFYSRQSAQKISI